MYDEERAARNEPSRLELFYELEQLWTWIENPEFTPAFLEAEQLRRGRERRRLRLLGREDELDE